MSTAKSRRFSRGGLYCRFQRERKHIWLRGLDQGRLFLAVLPFLAYIKHAIFRVDTKYLLTHHEQFQQEEQQQPEHRKCEEEANHDRKLNICRQKGEESLAKIRGHRGEERVIESVLKLIKANYRIFRSKPNNNEGFCKLKSAVACPQHLLDILLKQTDLTEPQIHVRYMKFRHLYPTGFVGPHVLRNLCLDVLNEQVMTQFKYR